MSAAEVPAVVEREVRARNVERELVELAWSSLAPPESVTVSQWAAANRVLTAEEGCAEPGEWRNERTPYLVEIMDALTRGSPVERVAVMKSAQVGFTEAGNNWLGYLVDAAPGPALAVQPTRELMLRWAGERLSKVFRSTPGIAAKVREVGGGRSTLRRRFPGGILVVGNARSASSLASMPARDLFLDEVDRYPADVGGEGDPVSLAEARTNTFRRQRKILIGSTPTVKDVSRIEAEWLKSDQRFYHVPCPHCGTYQRLVWDHVVWTDLDLEPGEAVYVCEECDGEIESWQKGALLADGEWIPTYPERKVRGYHLSALYSPWLTFGDVAEAFVKAKNDPWALQAWVNLWLGEPWEDRVGERLERGDLLARRESWFSGPGGEPGVPSEVLLLTAGVDVQADRIEVEAVGWGHGEESWSVDVRRIYGDPESGLAVWRDLEEYLATPFPVEGGGEMKIRATCVDTGFAAVAAYRFVREQERRGRRVFAIKGVSRVGEPIPLWPRKPKRSSKGKVNVYSLGVDAAKDEIYARLRGKPPGPGSCHFGFDRDREYFEQLTAERRRTKFRNGFAVRYWWKPAGARNEALDLRVYALAALHSLYASGMRLRRRLDEDRPRPRRSGASKADGWMSDGLGLGTRFKDFLGRR